MVASGQYGNTVHGQYNNVNYGPTFGGGHDWYVNSTMNGGSCSLGYTYACQTGSYGSSSCNTDFCGSSSGSWAIVDYEVWVK